jgi:hypothetical protein
LVSKRLPICSCDCAPSYTLQHMGHRLVQHLARLSSCCICLLLGTCDMNEQASTLLEPWAQCLSGVLYNVSFALPGHGRLCKPAWYSCTLRMISHITVRTTGRDRGVGCPHAAQPPTGINKWRHKGGVHTHDCFQTAATLGTCCRHGPATADAGLQMVGKAPYPAAPFAHSSLVPARILGGNSGADGIACSRCTCCSVATCQAPTLPEG